MWHNHGIVVTLSVTTLARDILNRLGQIRHIRLVQCAGHLVRHESLHEDVDPESVEALGDKGVDRGEIGPSIVCAINAWKGGLAKLGARLVDTSELHLVHAFLVGGCRDGEGRHYGSCEGDQEHFAW